MSLAANWTREADRAVKTQSTEIDTTSLAQYVLEETWQGEDPDTNEIDLAFNEIKSYLVSVWACNPDT